MPPMPGTSRRRRATRSCSGRRSRWSGTTFRRPSRSSRRTCMKAPTDVPAIRMLAEVAMRIGRDDDAQQAARALPRARAGLHARALQLRRRCCTGATTPARRARRGRAPARADPRNPGYRNLHAVILSRVGEYERSSRHLRRAAARVPANAKVWLSYGHVLKTEGRQDESIDAYRRASRCDPAFGEAYWSLANLKTFRFDRGDLAAMRAQARRPGVDDANRVHFHFALGKACEDAGDYAQRPSSTMRRAMRCTARATATTRTRTPRACSA